jgi:hypothetical protein
MDPNPDVAHAAPMPPATPDAWDPGPHEIPAATIAQLCRTWEAVLEAKYPGTRWHIHPPADDNAD